MKKNILFSILFVLFAVFFTGCSEVSADEYEKMKSQYESLQEKYNSLSEEYDSLSTDFDYCSTELNSIKNQETEPAYTTNYIFSEAYPSAAIWVKSSFGDNAFYSEMGTISDKSSKKYFQVIVPSNYTASDANDAFDRVKSSLVTLEVCGLTYDEISIKYIYDDQGTFIDFSLIRAEDSGSYSLHTICGNLTDCSSIISALQ